MEPPETHYARSGDVSVAFQVSGSGPVDLVCAPGTVSHLDLDWELPPRVRFMRRLERFCRLIRFDKRGTGLSDRVDGVATLEERTDDIRAVMDAAGSERAFIFGQSEGANMACLFAATYPHRTRGLLVWGGLARWVRTVDYPWGVTPEDAQAEIAGLGQNGVTREYIAGAFGSPVQTDEDVHWLPYLWRYFRAAASPAALAALERMNMDVDIRDVLPTIKVPTLVMNATEDEFAPVEGARDLAARIPGARFVTFPGGHRFFLNDAVAQDLAAEMEEFVTGTRSAPDPDRVLATVLFTDIVGSTEQLASLGDQVWRDRVTAHYDMVRRELERYHGREVDTAGDGFLATFDAPGRAVMCAQAIIDAVRPLDIRVRAGVHTGECELIGDKVGGIAVHIGARVAALAGPSEVLVSSTVRDLTAGSGIRLEDVGEHVLKGVPDVWHLYRAVR